MRVHVLTATTPELILLGAYDNPKSPGQMCELSIPPVLCANPSVKGPFTAPANPKNPFAPGPRTKNILFATVAFPTHEAFVRHDSATNISGYATAVLQFI